MAFTLLSRKTGEGIRVVLRPGAFSPDEEHLALIRKIVSGEADEDEKKKFQEIHFRRSCDVLATPPERLFVMKPVKTELPPRPRSIVPQPCSVCGEPTMAAKLLCPRAIGRFVGMLGEDAFSGLMMGGASQVVFREMKRRRNHLWVVPGSGTTARRSPHCLVLHTGVSTTPVWKTVRA